MRLNFVAIETALARRLPFSISVTRAGKMIFLASRTPLRMDTLETVLAETVTETLSETLSETVTDTLSDTLRETDFLEKTLIVGEGGAGKRGEDPPAYCYYVDGYVLNTYVQEVIRHLETCRIWALIEGLTFPISARWIQGQLKILGTRISTKRANAILADLQQAGRLEANGHFRTRGRDVVKR